MDIEIKKENWKDFFESLSKRRFEWKTAVEVLSPESGDQRLISGLPLNGFTVETKDGSISIVISAGESTDVHQTHTINDPVKVVFHGVDDSFADVIDIEEDDGTKTLITFIEPMEIMTGYFSELDMIAAVSRQDLRGRETLPLAFSEVQMIEVREMSSEEINEVLERGNYGHLACSSADQPYVVPIHYVVHGSDIYFYTTEGKKSEIIDANPKICLQVEEVIANDDWRSVIITGIAKQIISGKNREEAIKLIQTMNPTLMPALSIRWMDNWIRANHEVVYKITPHTTTGRSTNKVEIAAAFAGPATGKHSKIL